MNRVEGIIVKVHGDKRFGWIRINGMKGEYFFHKDDYKGSWEELVSGSSKPKISGIIVESPKGPRVGDVTPIAE